MQHGTVLEASVCGALGGIQQLVEYQGEGAPSLTAGKSDQSVAPLGNPARSYEMSWVNTVATRSAPDD